MTIIEVTTALNMKSEVIITGPLACNRSINITHCPMSFKYFILTYTFLKNKLMNQTHFKWLFLSIYMTNSHKHIIILLFAFRNLFCYHSTTYNIVHIQIGVNKQVRGQCRVECDWHHRYSRWGTCF